MLTIWGRKTSSNVQALMWCIGELGLEYERHDVGHVYGGTDTPQFLALNPNGTVPVLKDGDNPPLWETGSILRYLANQYSDDPFWPRDNVLKSHVDKWAEWAKLNVAQAFTVPIFWQVVRTSPNDQDQNAIRQAVVSFEKTLGVAETQLKKHAFLTGDAFTLADIQFAHVLFRYFDISIERQNLPALKTYYERLCNRPAFEQHVMLDYSTLRVT